MSRTDSDDPILRALRQLPRLQASPGFSARVLARLDARAAPRPRLPRWALAGAALLLLAFGLGGFEYRAWQARESSRQAAAAELRRELGDLRRELDQIKSLAAEQPPALYLGGDDRVDLVLDLGPWAEELGRTDIRPASLGGEPRRR